MQVKRLKKLQPWRSCGGEQGKWPQLGEGGKMEEQEEKQKQVKVTCVKDLKKEQVKVTSVEKDLKEE